MRLLNTKKSKAVNPLEKLARELGLDSSGKEFRAAIAEWLDSLEPTPPPFVDEEKTVKVDDGLWTIWLELSQIDERLKEARKLEKRRAELIQTIRQALGDAGRGVCKHGTIIQQVHERSPYFARRTFWYEITGIPATGRKR